MFDFALITSSSSSLLLSISRHSHAHTASKPQMHGSMHPHAGQQGNYNAPSRRNRTPPPNSRSKSLSPLRSTLTHRQSEGNNVRFAADNWAREEQHDTAAAYERGNEGNDAYFAAQVQKTRDELQSSAAYADPPDDPFGQQKQYDSAADDHGHVFGSQSQFNSNVNFADLAATVADPAPDPEGQQIHWGGIQTQPSHTSSAEPVYPHLDQHGQAHPNSRMYQVDESFDFDDDTNYIGEVDYSERTRRANEDSFPVSNYDEGANKKWKAKIDEDDVENLFDGFSEMSM